VLLARLTRARGNKGELTAQAFFDHRERFDAVRRVLVGDTEYELESVWYHRDQPVFKFKGVDSIGDAERLAGLEVSVLEVQRFPLPEGEYYLSDLVGCRMLEDASGRVVGVVTGWEETGGPAVLDIDEGRVSVPFAKSIVKSVDLRSREIRVDLPEGLEELNA